MTIEAIFVVIGLPLFAHAGLIFIQSFRKGPSQYDDLLRVQISGLSNPMSVQELCDIKLCSKFYCKELLASVLIWSNRLRKIGFIPILLYLFFMFLTLFEFVLKEQVNTKLLFSILVSAAILIQVFYVLLKMYSNIPQLLIHLHGNYKNSSYLFVLLDIVPILKR